MNLRALTAVAACTALCVLAGCVEPPPSSAPSPPAPPAAVGVESAQQRLEQSVRGYTLRLRNLRCDDVVIGSGFAIDRRTVITNRHVVEQGRRLEVETWDGQPLAARPLGASYVRPRLSQFAGTLWKDSGDSA